MSKNSSPSISPSTSPKTVSLSPFTRQASKSIFRHPRHINSSQFSFLKIDNSIIRYDLNKSLERKSEEKPYLIIHLPGNASNLDNYEDFFFKKTEKDIIAVSPTIAGDFLTIAHPSTNETLEMSIRLRAEVIKKILRENPKYDIERIIFFGHSIGAALIPLIIKELKNDTEFYEQYLKGKNFSGAIFNNTFNKLSKVADHIKVFGVENSILGKLVKKAHYEIDAGQTLLENLNISTIYIRNSSEDEMIKYKDSLHKFCTENKGQLKYDDKVMITTSEEHNEYFGEFYLKAIQYCRENDIERAKQKSEVIENSEDREVLITNNNQVIVQEPYITTIKELKVDEHFGKTQKITTKNLGIAAKNQRRPSQRILVSKNSESIFGNVIKPESAPTFRHQHSNLRAPSQSFEGQRSILEKSLEIPTVQANSSSLNN